MVIISGIILDVLPIHVPNGIDKIYHFVAFAILSIVIILCYVEFYGTKFINRFLVCLLLLGGIVACCSELLQKLSSIERDCSALDWLFDILAIGVVGIISYLYYSRKNK